MSGWSATEIIAYLDRVEPRLGRLSFFELLDVTPETDARGLREAFYRKASALHPDLYRVLISPEDHERLTTVYARIAEAYLVLRDPGSRDAYLRALAARQQGGRADGDSRGHDGHDGHDGAEAMLPAKARRLYQRARASMRMGDRTSAVLNLKLAIAASPTSALLRQALSEALAQDQDE